MEEMKSQKLSEKFEEYKCLSNKICRVHLYDTLKFLACIGVIGACCEIALFSNSNKVRSTALATAACVGLSNAGLGHLLNKKKQKLSEQRTQVLKEYAQLSKA